MNIAAAKEQHVPASRKIEAALLALLKTKPYNSISVSELAEAAGVSRQSFYLSFENKEAVLHGLFVRLFGDIMVEVDSSGIVSMDGLVRKYTDIVEKHAEIFKLLADNDLGPLLGRVFVGEFVKRAPVLKIQKIPANEDERLYINSFWVSAFIDVYTAWLKNGMITGKDELNRILTDIMTGNYFKQRI